MRKTGDIVTSGTAKLHSQIDGSEGAPTSLFVHGGGRTLDDFNVLDAHLGSFRRLAMDTRGHGASTLGSEKLDYPRLAHLGMTPDAMALEVIDPGMTPDAMALEGDRPGHDARRDRP
jgi:pimeloyl-ACP methyl ester carboxylesterase